MPFRARRDTRRSDRWLDLRFLLFISGAAIAMIAIMLDIGWLVWIAILVLFIGVILSLIARRTATARD